MAMRRWSLATCDGVEERGGVARTVETVPDRQRSDFVGLLATAGRCRVVGTLGDCGWSASESRNSAATVAAGTSRNAPD
jgi:hypothetical protein